MARFFDGANPDYFSGSTTVITAAPFTVAGWGRVNTAATRNIMWALAASGFPSRYYLLSFLNAADGQEVRFRAEQEPFNPAFADSTTSYTVGKWHHLCGVEVTSSSRCVYLDGAGKGTNALPEIPAGVNLMALGILDRGTAGTAQPFDGDIAHVALWDVALTDAEVASLAAGVSPLAIRRDSLVAYFPLGGQSPERDIVGELVMTTTGSPAIAEEPPIPHSVVAPGA